MRVWLFLNSISIAAIGAILFLMVRQIGFILKRVGPVGARSTSDGPRIGENVVHYFSAMRSAADKSGGKSKLVIFGSDACSICAVIKKGAETLSKVWSMEADLYLIYDCEEKSGESALTILSKGLFFARDCNLRKQLGVTFVPFAMVLDHAGTVIGKGLVNEIGHLESLLELEKSTVQKPRIVSPDREARA
jgi:methylamine dehydrogenase accessory protein MauD